MFADDQIEIVMDWIKEHWRQYDSSTWTHNGYIVFQWNNNPRSFCLSEYQAAYLAETMRLYNAIDRGWRNATYFFLPTHGPLLPHCKELRILSYSDACSFPRGELLKHIQSL